MKSKLLLFTIAFTCVFSSLSEGRVGKALKRPYRLIPYSLGGSGTPILAMSAVGCVGLCMGNQYEVFNTGTGPIPFPLSFNLPMARETPEFDGEIYISASNCPAILNAGTSCVISVTLEPGGTYNGCSTLVLKAQSAKVLEATAEYYYGDCGLGGGEQM